VTDVVGDFSKFMLSSDVYIYVSQSMMYSYVMFPLRIFVLMCLHMIFTWGCMFIKVINIKLFGQELIYLKD
jgi:hypothetical protein